MDLALKRMVALWLMLGVVAPAVANPLPPVRTVFLIVMEKTAWAAFKGNTKAPFLNSVLLPQSACCEQSYNPRNFTVSLLRYLWVEAGTDFGITNGAPGSDEPPAINHQATTNHLVTLLDNAGIAWKAYEQSMPSNTVPLDNA
jgi:hypothetical protein